MNRSRSKVVLITGVTGFVGSHLAEYLVERNCEVFGVTRWRSNRENLRRIIDRVTLLTGDLTDFRAIYQVFDQVRPDVIYHLAAQSYVPVSYSMPTATIDTNVNGTINLLEAVRATNSSAVVVGITSSEVYGDTDDVPITENSQFRPSSPYGVSKVGQDMALLQYFISYGTKTIRIRNFTTTGPGRGDVFFESSFAKQLAAIKVFDYSKEVYVGNLDSVRVLVHVKDMVRAYHLAERHCVAGEAYNVGGSIPISVGGVLEKLIEISNIKNIKVTVKESLLRPADVTNQIPSVEKFKKVTNWEPRMDYDTILTDLYTYWIVELQKNPWKLKTIT